MSGGKTSRWGGALAALALAGAAWAGPPGGPAPEDRQDPARGEHMERRMRTLRAVGVAEALELDVPDALKADALMRPFDERRRPLQRQMHESMKVLRQAADGDPKAAERVDDATQKLLDAKAQMSAVDREMFAALAQGRTAQQKARLALFLAHFHEDVRGMRRDRQGPQ